MEKSSYSLADYFGANLAKLLAKKIEPVYPAFETKRFVHSIQKNCSDKTLTQRVSLIADTLHELLPGNYKRHISILTKIMGEENPSQTGMFKNYYWLMPVGKYIETYGLEDFDTSMRVIEELTKRNTGEYAIRPYIRKYPKQSLQQMKTWARSGNFHLRRLASEGLRPKLPWAAKLDLFIDNPKPVFSILELLKKEQVMFVKKSVANHLTDYIKLNPGAAFALIGQWEKTGDTNTQWIIRHATRKYT